MPGKQGATGWTSCFCADRLALETNLGFTGPGASQWRESLDGDDER